jgi:ribulose-phosphate 3-epimerase
MQICPSILESTADGLMFQINKLSPYIKYFQIDIADGIFVKSKTVQIDDIIKDFKQFNKYQSLVFDFHLMVADFESDIKKINQLKKLINIKNIFIHFSAISNFKFQISNLSVIPIGMTLNPKDSVNDLTNHFNLKKVPLIQIMSVTPGVQGNPFIPETLNKIEQLRKLDYRNKIYLDGAVNDKTLPFINNLKYKPDVVCPGSYLTKTKTLKKNVEYLNRFSITN